MIHLTRSLVRRWLDSLLHIDDTPERTAAAFALGVFFGFSPLLGFHTILGVVFAFLLNVNRVAVLLGVYSNLPWIIGQYYVFATVVGAVVTRTGLPDNYRERLIELFDHSVQSSEFWRELGQVFEPLLVPYLVGSVIGSVVLAALAYPIALTVIRQRRNLALRAKAASHKSAEQPIR